MDLYYWLFPPIMTAAPLLMVWFADRTLPPAPNTPFRRWGKVLLPVLALAIIAGSSARRSMRRAVARPLASVTVA